MTTPFVNDDWDSMASTGILTQERAFIAGYFDILAIGGTVYLVAGYDGKIIRYNSTNISWDTIATFTGTNNGSIWSAYFKGKIYVFNGSPNDGSPPFVRSFDP
jgi:N-acetylneuraminic acid mutarotase